MSRLIQLARGISMNWISLGFTLLVTFFLSPFVVHHLGNVAYGAWVLVGNAVSYMGLLDLGLRSSVVRYASKGYAQGDHVESSEAVSAALWLRLWISALIILAGVTLSLVFTRIFHIPPQLQTPARLAIFAIAFRMAISLACGVFGGVIAGLNRFDLLAIIEISQTALQTIGFIWLLEAGHGILGLALCSLAAGVAGSVAQVICAVRLYPQMKILFRRPAPATLRKLWRYSFYVLLVNIATQLVYYSDNVVVGAFLSTTAVTFYAIGGSLINYGRQIVSSMTTTFAPLASTLEAEKNADNMRRLLIHGTRAALLVALPIYVALFVRGRTFLGLWMGAQYAYQSGRVMQILLISQAFASANTTSGGIAYGIEKHRMVAIWAVFEGIANLTLSIFLVRKIGIYGVAWGTTIPSLVIHLIFWPPYICKLVDMPVRRYIYQSWIRPGIAVVPFGVACYLADRYWPVRHLWQFMEQILILFPTFVLMLPLLFGKELSLYWQRWNTRRAAQAGAVSQG
jgi:O-antigen/teichoic acid export membrane protein